MEPEEVRDAQGKLREIHERDPRAFETASRQVITIAHDSARKQKARQTLSKVNSSKLSELIGKAPRALKTAFA